MDIIYNFSGSPGITSVLTVSNIAVPLPDTQLSTSWTRSRAIASIITCEGASVRIAFNIDPTNSFGHILYPGQSLYLSNPVAVRTFRVIQANAGQTAILHITHEYALGK